MCSEQITTLPGALFGTMFPHRFLLMSLSLYSLVKNPAMTSLKYQLPAVSKPSLSCVFWAGFVYSLSMARSTL